MLYKNKIRTGFDDVVGTYMYHFTPRTHIIIHKCTWDIIRPILIAFKYNNNMQKVRFGTAFIIKINAKSNLTRKYTLFVCFKIILWLQIIFTTKARHPVFLQSSAGILPQTAGVSPVTNRSISLPQRQFDIIDLWNYQISKIIFFQTFKVFISWPWRSYF